MRICSKFSANHFNTIKLAIFARTERSIMIFSYFNDFDAMILRSVRLKDSDFGVFLGLYFSGFVIIKGNIINIPVIFQVPDYFSSIRKAKRDREAWPIIFDGLILEISSSAV